MRRVCSIPHENLGQRREGRRKGQAWEDKDVKMGMQSEMGANTGPCEDTPESASKERDYSILLKHPLSSRPALFPQIPFPSSDPVS